MTTRSTGLTRAHAVHYWAAAPRSDRYRPTQPLTTQPDPATSIGQAPLAALGSLSESRPGAYLDRLSPSRARWV